MKLAIPYQHSSFFRYLLALLFITYNTFFYLYLRLTLISSILIFALPCYQWIAIILVLFITGYQLLPLQIALNDIIIHYPISELDFKSSFLNVLIMLLSAQLFIIISTLLFHTALKEVILALFIGILFIIVFFRLFTSKRIRSFRYLD